VYSPRLVSPSTTNTTSTSVQLCLLGRCICTRMLCYEQGSSDQWALRSRDRSYSLLFSVFCCVESSISLHGSSFIMRRMYSARYCAAIGTILVLKFLLPPPLARLVAAREAVNASTGMEGVCDRQAPLLLSCWVVFIKTDCWNQE
jgi:hypothetical protein